MKHILSFLLVFLTAALIAAPSVDPPDGEPMKTLRVYVDNVRDAQGTIWIGVYTGEDDFLDREKARLVSVKVNATGRAYVDIPDLMVGKEYALGLFHDVDDNGEFDLNWLGLPSEPWAFSGDPKTRLRLPYFGEVSFLFAGEVAGRVIRLRKW